MDVGKQTKTYADKTHLMTVCTGARLRMKNSKVKVVMDGIDIEESDEKFETLLGCMIEPDLKWHKQVDKLLLRLKVRLAALQTKDFGKGVSTAD